MEWVKKAILLLIAAFLISSCDQDDITCLRVSGDIATQKRKVEPFKSIFFNDVGNIYISQGNEQEVLVKGQENVVSAFNAEVVDGNLRMYLEQCFNGDDYQLDIYITAPDFEQIEMAGTGMVQSETAIVADDLLVIHSGVTNVFDLEIRADSLETLLIGNGDIKYSGNVNHHEVTLSGIGSIGAYAFPAKTADITINNKGDVLADVSEKIKVIINSSGNLYYKGAPELVATNNGTGEVIDAN